VTEVKSLTTSSLAHGLTTIIVVAGSRAVRGKITVSGLSNCLIYCYIFIVCTKFTDVAAGRMVKPGEPRIGDSGLDRGLL
jgi:hypothetical protein